ncbi:MAG: Bax inhibitor-1 family protein [Bacilli bacterium]
MNEFTPEATKQENVGKNERKHAEFSMMRVMLWLGIGLLITAVVSLTYPNLLLFIFKDDVDGMNIAYVATLAVSIVMMLVSMLVVHLKASKKDSALSPIFYLIYTISVGFLLSSTFLTILGSEQSDAIGTISVAFFVTAGCFIVMGLIGFLTKRSLNILIPLIITLVIGAVIISLVNFFMQSSIVYWITDFVLFGVILVITAVDINNIKKIAEAGVFYSSLNMSIYCAFSLYVDFINIFIRVLTYVAMSKRNS